MIPTAAMLIWCVIPLAAGNGVTIEPETFDSPGIAAAFTKAKAGDTVRLPAGTFKLDEAVRLKSEVKFVGAGQDKTRLVYRGRKPSVLVSFAACQDVELAGMTLDGNSDKLVQQGIAGGDSRRMWIHHVTIRDLVNSKGWGPHGILLSGWNPSMEHGVTDSRISDCRIENVGLGAEYGGGIRMAWGCVRNVVEGVTIHKTGRGGIFGDHSAELIVRNNRVTGSGGEGLGIELWGGCPRSLVEDNTIDHWLSMDGANQSAARRNVIGAEDGTTKFLGIEIIARDVVVTDNAVKRGAQIGLSMSNQAVKNNVYWAYNTVSDCIQWGAQLQGDKGGIARNYFYKCTFENTVRGDPHAAYPSDSGHGFRTNGTCRELVLENCVFRKNGGLGVQLGGKDVDVLGFLRCTIADNSGWAVSPPPAYTALEFTDCTVRGNGPSGGAGDTLPPAKPLPGSAPTAEFRAPATIRAGEPAEFQCTSKPGPGKDAKGNDDQIVERLWDFGQGIPEVTPTAKHTYPAPGRYRLTLIVWTAAGRGGRVEKTIDVLAH